MAKSFKKDSPQKPSRYKCGKCTSASDCMPGIFQTVSEMDFERGIWSAANDGDLARVKKLLDKGVSPDATDSFGYRPIHYAARNGHIEVCKKLLNHGANVNAVTRCMSATPLHRAVTQGHFEVVKILLKQGADPFIKDADGKTALDRAIAVPINLTMTSIAALLIQCHEEEKNLSEDLRKAEEEIHRYLGQKALEDFRKQVLSSVRKKFKNSHQEDTEKQNEDSSEDSESKEYNISKNTESREQKVT